MGPKDPFSSQAPSDTVTTVPWRRFNDYSFKEVGHEAEAIVTLPHNTGGKEIVSPSGESPEQLTTDSTKGVE